MLVGPGVIPGAGICSMHVDPRTWDEEGGVILVLHSLLEVSCLDIEFVRLVSRFWEPEPTFG